MYFVINKTGCSEIGGLCQVRYDLYLEENDERYAEHHVQVPVIPFGGYPGEVDSSNMPVDMVAYQAWFDGLDRAWQNGPFCCHFVQFSPDVTDDEILLVGEAALALQYENWCDGDLGRKVNDPPIYTDDAEQIAAAQGRIGEIKATDFTAIAGDYSVRR